MDLSPGYLEERKRRESDPALVASLNAAADLRQQETDKDKFSNAGPVAEFGATNLRAMAAGTSALDDLAGNIFDLVEGAARKINETLPVPLFKSFEAVGKVLGGMAHKRAEEIRANAAALHQGPQDGVQSWVNKIQGGIVEGAIGIMPYMAAEAATGGTVTPLLVRSGMNKINAKVAQSMVSMATVDAIRAAHETPQEAGIAAMKGAFFAAFMGSLGAAVDAWHTSEIPVAGFASKLRNAQSKFLNAGTMGTMSYLEALGQGAPLPEAVSQGTTMGLLAAGHETPNIEDFRAAVNYRVADEKYRAWLERRSKFGSKEAAPARVEGETATRGPETEETKGAPPEQPIIDPDQARSAQEYQKLLEEQAAQKPPEEPGPGAELGETIPWNEPALRQEAEAAGMQYVGLAMGQTRMYHDPLTGETFGRGPTETLQSAALRARSESPIVTGRPEVRLPEVQPGEEVGPPEIPESRRAIRTGADMPFPAESPEGRAGLQARAAEKAKGEEVDRIIRNLELATTLQRAMPNAKIRMERDAAGRDVWNLELPKGRSIRVFEDHIEVDVAALDPVQAALIAEGYGPTGETRVSKMGKQAVIRLGKFPGSDEAAWDETTPWHEAFHAALRMAAEPQEVAAVLKPFIATSERFARGQRAEAEAAVERLLNGEPMKKEDWQALRPLEEDAAEAYAEWSGFYDVAPAFVKVRDFFGSLYRGLTAEAPTEQDVARKIRGGSVWTNAEGIAATPEGEAALQLKRAAGAPDLSPYKMGRMRKDVERLLQEGEPARRWYKRSAESIRAMFPDKEQQKLFVQAIAITSPRAQVGANLNMALKAMAQYAAGDPIHVGTSKVDRALNDLFYQGLPWGGIKRTDFMDNLMNAVEGDPLRPVIDMWMARAFGFDAPGGKITKAQYEWISAEVTKLAEKHDIPTDEAQAAIWTAIKARWEPVRAQSRERAVRRGIGEFVPDREGRQKFEVIPGREREFEQVSRQEAMRHTPTPEEIEKAGRDFSYYLNQYLGQVSFEFTTGAGSGMLTGMQDAPLEQRKDHFIRMMDALTDEQGRFIIAREFKLPVAQTMEGSGGYDWYVNPSGQIVVPMLHTPGKKAIDPKVRADMDALAATIGLLVHQDAVAYHRFFAAPSINKANGADVDVGRKLTPEETQKFYTAVAENLYKAATEKEALLPGIAKHAFKGKAVNLAPIPTPRGVRVLNFEKIDNTLFHEAVDRAVEESLPKDLEARIGYASVPEGGGNYITATDWGNKPYGENYRAVLDSSGRSETFQRIADLVRPRIDEVYAESARRYGWGLPEGAGGKAGEEGEPGSYEIKRPKEYPEEFRGWSYDGEWEGTGIHQYTDKDPESPTYRNTIAVKSPDQLRDKINEKRSQFGAGPLYEIKPPQEGPRAEKFRAWWASNPTGVKSLEKKGSVVIDENGDPMPVYHGTDFAFDAFERGDVGFHFGTAGQAIDRLATKGKLNLEKGRGPTFRIPGAFMDLGDIMGPGERGEPLRISAGARTIPVFLNIKNPLRISDMGAFIGYTAFAEVRDKIGITGKESLRWFDRFRAAQDDDAAEMQVVREMLKAHGFDGIVYRNQGESDKPGGRHTAFRQKDSWIAIDPRQIKSPFNEEFDPESPLYELKKYGAYAPPFFSVAKAVADERLPENIKPESLVNTLMKYGVRRSEIDALRLKDMELMYRQKGEKIPKPDIQLWIENAAVNIEERHLSGENQFGGIDWTPGPVRLAEGVRLGDSYRGPIKWRAVINGKIVEIRRSVVYGDKGPTGAYEGRELRFIAYDSRGEEIGRANTLQEAKIQTQAALRADQSGQMIQGGDYKFKEWSLAQGRGARKYTELLMTFVDPQVDWKWLEKYYGEKGNRSYEFRGSHWSEYPNVFASALVDERVLSTGEKVLFVNEIQSDWGIKHRKGLAPAAPFVTDASWQNLLLKRLVRYAAENSYERIAWSTGEQIQQKYDLGNKVAWISYYPAEGVIAGAPRGWQMAWAKDEYGRTGNGTRFVPDAELEDFVGAEIAAKMRAGAGRQRKVHPGGPDAPGKVLSGEDLVVGKRWPLNLYDKAIPEILSSLGKKDGAKFETGNVVESRKAEFVSGEMAMEEAGIPVEHRNEYWRNLTDEERNAMLKKWWGNVKEHEVHTMTIPPSLAQKALYEGFPLYQLKKAQRPQVFVEPIRPERVEEFLGAKPGATATEGRQVGFNMDKVNTEQDVKDVIAKTLMIAPDMDSDIGGHKTLDQMVKEAKRYGFQPDELISRKDGEAYNFKQLWRAKEIVAANARELAQSNREYQDTGSPEAKERTAKLLALQLEYQRQLGGARREASWALNVLRNDVTGETAYVEKMNELLTRVGPGVDFEVVSGMLKTLESPEQVARMTAKMREVKTPDMLLEVWINSLLSGPQTHMANSLSNLMTANLGVMERFVASYNPLPKKAFFSVAPGEAQAMVHGMTSGIMDALRIASYVAKTGEVGLGVQKVDLPHRKAIAAENMGLDPNSAPGRAIDTIGQIVRLPTRFMGAEDEFFKAVNYRMELNAQAYRQAYWEGLRGAELKSRVSDLLENPTDQMQSAARDFALYQTFNNKAGAFGQWLMGSANAHPMLRLVLPFVRTPLNIFKYSLERMPGLNLLSKSYREDLAAGGSRRELALAKMATGGMVMAMVSQLAAAGMITGEGPDDRNLRRTMIDAGWQPYSIRIGNDWISYNRLDPIGALFGAGATFAEIAGQIPEFELSTLGTAGVLAFSEAMLSKTYLSGLADVTRAIIDPERSAKSVARRYLSSAVPGIVAQANRAFFDRNLHEMNSVLDAARARIPGLSKDLPLRRNIFGEGIYLEGGLGPDFISPVYTTGAHKDAVAEEIVKQGVSLAMPTKYIFGRRPDESGMKPPSAREGVPLKPEEYDRYVRLAGNELKDPRTGNGMKEMLAEMFRTPEYRGGTDGPDGTKAIMIHRVVNGYRTAARAQLLREYPVLQELLSDRTLERAKALGAVEVGR